MRGLHGERLSETEKNLPGFENLAGLLGAY
jgi:hypothetical protein